MRKISQDSFKNMFIKYTKFIIRNYQFFLLNPKKYVYASEKKMVAFWVTPWLGTPCPWYVLAYAQMYSKIYKEPVTVIVNDLFYDSKIHSYKELENLLGKTLKLLTLNRNIHVIKLSELSDCELSNEEYEIIDKCADFNTIWQLRSSVPGYGYNRLKEKWRKELIPVCNRICSLLDNSEFRFVIPGGMFAETGFLVEKLKERDFEYYSIDCVPEILVMAKKSLAAQTGDAKSCYEIIRDDNNVDQLIYESKKLFETRIDGKIENSAWVKNCTIQQSSFQKNNNDNIDILICPNLEYDTAAIGTHLAFRNDYEWITETIEFILKETEYTVAVREHPMQAIFEKKTRLDYLKKYENNERFKLYTCKNKINTYSLINKAKIVIVDTSHIGIEAAIMGKNVLLDSNAFYANASFVNNVTNKNDYFNFIKGINGKEKRLTFQDIKEAYIYYGISSICCGAETAFKPDNGEFYKWVETDVRTLIKSEDTKMLFAAINKDISLILLKYYKLFKK